MSEASKSTVVAPFVGKVDKNQPSHSFAAYFLRDLHRQGRLNENLIRQVAADKGLVTSPDDLLHVIKSSDDVISEAVARDLETVASVGSVRN